jgi:hypothetical protein
MVTSFFEETVGAASKLKEAMRQIKKVSIPIVIFFMSLSQRQCKISYPCQYTKIASIKILRRVKNKFYTGIRRQIPSKKQELK